MSWHPEVLPANWARAADDLAARGVTTVSYLAGGTALALQLGHRRSVDLDLFREDDFATDAVRDQLAGLAGLRNVELAPGTVYFELHGVKVSLLRYPYPLLFPVTAFGGFAVADARDIASMKIDTIASRGARRDFVDLYIAAQHYGLPAIVEWFETKYAAVQVQPGAHSQVAHLLRRRRTGPDARYDRVTRVDGRHRVLRAGGAAADTRAVGAEAGGSPGAGERN